MKLNFLLKTVLFAIAITAASSNVWGQTTINFDDAEKWTAGSVAVTSYASDHVYSDGVFSATGGPALRNGTAAQDGFPGAFGTYSWRLQNVATVEWIITISSGGVSDFSMNIRRWDATPSADFSLDYSTNEGTSWTNVTTINNTSLDNSSDWKTFSGTINSANQNIKIRLKANGTTERIMVDDFTWAGYSSGGNQNPIISNIVQSPSQYIQYNQTVSVSADVTDSDGTVENVELRWGVSPDNLNNTILMTLSEGNTYTTVSNIPSQYNGITIYYEIYAEDNDFDSATSSLNSFFVSPINYYETFDADLGDCYTYSVSGDSQFWKYYASTQVAQMNGYNTGEVEEDWLILPGQNLDAQDLLLSFDSWKRYGTTDANNYLTLYYSSNYPGQGDPTQFTWKELTFTQPEAEQVWTPSGTIDLSNISGTSVYLGFKYHYTVENYVSWNIDNIKFERKTYTVNYNVVDGTTPTGTDPINTATVDFYGAEKLTNASGQTTYSWVEIGENVPFTVTKEGFHEFNGTLNVVNRNITQQVRLLSTKVAVNVFANPDANSAVISWEGSGAESYGIWYYEPDTQNEFYVTASETGKTILVSPSTTYSVRVRSLVNGVWSGYSPAVSFTTLAGTPVIANNIQVSNITSSSAEISWIGEGATSYGIYYYDLNSSANFYVTSTSSPKIITVSPETTYGLRVRSMVNGQWSSYTSPISFTSLSGTPIIASNISVNNITSSNAQVSWTGSGAEAYGIYYYDINTSNWNYISSTTSPTNIIVSPETTYNLMVKSKVNGQWSPYSMPVQFTTPSGGQILATNVIVNNITPNSADVSWLGSGAEWYFVYYVETGTANYYYKYSKSSPTTLNLEPEKNYTLMVKTRINGQWSSYTSPISFSTPIAPKTAPASFGMDNSKLILPENLLVYPNPAKDYTKIRFTLRDVSDVTVNVYSIGGVLVKTEKFLNSFGEVEAIVNLNDVSNGVYIIQIVTLGHSESRRLLVQ